MNGASSLALNAETYRWLLWGGVGLLGAWLVLRLVLALTSILVRTLWIAGVLFLLLWAVTRFL